MDTSPQKVTKSSTEMFLPHTIQENSTKLSKALDIKSDCGKKLKARKNIKIHSPASDDIPLEELTKIGIYIPSQYILDEEVSSKNMRQKYQEDFMGKVDYLRKMFVSVKEDNNHWYLVVFDFRKQEVILLDSKPDPSKEDSKELTIKRLALYIEVMLQGATFYDSKRTVVPRVLKFNVTVPDEMSIEKCGSNDGGIWVAEWMNDCGWCDKYFSIDIDIDTQMMLALDLILHPYNLKRDVVIKSAQQNYTKIEKKCRTLARK
ncbi:hypothetical protein PIB30_040633 [Stylosanthes scabra]|uniref:Ubiquitin-like protease family profile domain-containing protein n=1 Tax=Stylosanthes scabra TaxID=79078 RepID=A0ABU6VDE9_9FABA|nr:hypothetical protein [Stylosanthes scabra]